MAGAVALLSVAIVVRASGQGPQVPSFHSDSSELVVLPVTVTDHRGQLVPDLPRDRFAVYDNGRRQPVGALLERGHTRHRRSDTRQQRQHANQAGGAGRGNGGVREGKQSRRWIFTLVFNDQVRNPLDGHPLFANDVPALTAALSALHPDGRTSMYDGLSEGLVKIADGTRPRKVLILISDGGDNASRTTLKAVLERARLSNVTIYTVGIFDSDDPDANPRVLKAIAETTGGERFLPQSPGPLMAVCSHIAREIRAGYTVGYTPPDRDGTYHRVRVEVDAPTGAALTVRTRPGYFAGGVPARPPR